MKKLISCIILIMLFTATMGSTVMASPEKSQTANTISINENSNSTFALPVVTQAYVNTITVYPLYTVPGKTETYYGLKSYTKRHTGYSQFLGITISPEMKAEMDNAVVANGYEQVGYYYEVNCKMSGANAYFTLNSPTDALVEMNGQSDYTIYVECPMDNPKLLLDGYFTYRYANKNQTRKISASSNFT